MVGLDDARLIPTSVVLSQREQRATREQASLLSIDDNAMLHAIVRVRSLAGKPAIFERIFVPVDVMPDLAVETRSEMDEEMYVIYQEKFGISIVRAIERLSAVAATAEEAKRLDLKPGAPLLEISRVATDVGGRPVELRISRCDTRRSRYAAEVL
jgi:GntR family transcriptional regulator